MSNVYAAYGPMPTSIGVTATPRLNGSLDRRAIQMGRAATLGRNPTMTLGRYPPTHSVGHSLACSYQDLRRSREYLDLKHGPMEPMQPLDTISMGGSSILRDSLDTFPTLPTSTLERRRNGGVTTGCSVHGGGTLSRPVSRSGSRYELSDDEPRGGGCGRSCCSLTFSILACLLILSGVIVALYFFIKNVPYDDQPPIQEEPCEKQRCAWGGECVMDQKGEATCICTLHCPPQSSTASPVCGTDGKTYKTMCELRRHACTSQQNTHIKHSGPCDDPGSDEGEDDDGTLARHRGASQDPTGPSSSSPTTAPTSSTTTTIITTATTIPTDTTNTITDTY